MAQTGYYGPAFTTGTILATGFGTLFSRFGPILLAAILIHLPLLLFLVLASPESVLSYANSPFLPLLVELAMSMILSGAISALVVAGLKGEGAGVGAALGTGFRRIFGIIGVTLLLAFVIGVPALVLGFIGALLGQVMFIIAIVAVVVVVLIIYARFWVALPVAVVEEADPFTALGISADMTRGRRGSIIGALIVLAIINGAVGFVAGRIIEGMIQSLDDLKPAMYVATAINTVVGMIGPVMAAAGYYLLAAEDGRLDETGSVAG